MKVLLIIPAYNEEGSLEAVVRRLQEDFSCYDFVVVNDGSSDGTEDICRRCGCRFLSHPVNLGLAGAFQTGMRYAAAHGYDCAMQFDADGQHDPQYIAAMVQAMEAGNNVVIGSRFVARKKPFSPRMLGSRLISFAVLLTTGKRLSDPTSGMRLYDRAMILRLADGNDLGPEPDTLAYFLHRGACVSEVQVTMRERTAGASYLTFSRSLAYMGRMFVSILFLQWVRKGKSL